VENGSLFSDEVAFPVSERAAIKLTDFVSDSEVDVMVHKWLSIGHIEALQRPELQHAFLNERFISWNLGTQELEREFIRFHLLRGLAKKVTLRWYDKKEWIQIAEEYVPNDDNLRTHVIVDEEELLRWRTALSSPIFRCAYSFGPHSHLDGSMTTWRGVPIPHNAIVLETDKEKIFIGITSNGFHLGMWESNRIVYARIFYCPELAWCLDDYVKKYKLEDFPVPVDYLSGEAIMRGWFQQRKREETGESSQTDNERQETETRND